MDIVFTNVSGFDELEKPSPASAFIPDWYKKIESYLTGEKKPNGSGSSASTIKKCMPVFDSITAGYIITLPADVYVSIKDGKQHFEWSILSLVEFHPVEQASNHPANNGYPYPKWINYWGITTPKGYSTMFVQPFHRESVFTILPGIVDTDKYHIPVNFPFVINDPKFEGLIPKGTPIAQVIPIKRDNWRMKFGTKHDVEKANTAVIKLGTKFYDKYKTMFRQHKEYK